MQLSKTEGYCLMGLLYLAKQDPEHTVPIPEIAEAIGISTLFLSKIFFGPKNADIIIPNRGVHGGFMLSKDPKSISIREIIEATNGPYDLVNCIHDSGWCDKCNSCVIRDALMKLNDELKAVIDKCSLRDFLD